MAINKALVITSIAGPDHPILNDYAVKCREKDVPFIVIGDKASPAKFEIAGCDFYSLDRQKELGFSISKILPEKHYGRKNIGYLVAIKGGAEIIIETDDDNWSRPEFWNQRMRKVNAHRVENTGWVNVYSYFSKTRVWPRGFALEFLQEKLTPLENHPAVDLDCPIQQGLADENPDVDALYRLTFPLPMNFEKGNNVALGKKAWCPFNSQNTTWFKDAFPLMYLPSYCSFRMTDIWRSFIAHRIAWENDWHLLFHSATVFQERNFHNLMRDFADEIPGYLNNHKIVSTLENLELKKGVQHLGNNLLLCYKAMAELSLVGPGEIPLVEAWLQDLVV